MGGIGIKDTRLLRIPGRWHEESIRFPFALPEISGRAEVCVNTIRNVEGICKNQGLAKRTWTLCKNYIIRHVTGNANGRRARLGMKMIKYFDRQCELLKDNKDIHQISSDIIESDFGIYKAKKSPKNCMISLHLCLCYRYIQKSLTILVLTNKILKYAWPMLNPRK